MMRQNIWDKLGCSFLCFTKFVKCLGFCDGFCVVLLILKLQIVICH
jgi:hypothetical protein